MKKVILFFLLVIALQSKAQLSPDEQKWYDKYKSEYWTGSDLIKLMDNVKFKPNRTDQVKYFKATLLALSKPAIDQLNRDAVYLAAVKHDDYLEIWNMFYEKITKETWDKYCKGLLALMCIDNTAKAR